MNKWETVAAAVYYSGAGIVLIGTGVRFFWSFLRNHLRETVEEIVEDYLSKRQTPLTKD